jgi:hypothetical protein
LGDNNGRDIGISISGNLLTLANRDLIEYRIGVFNGSGINKADLNEAKDVIGRLLIHPLQGLDIGGSFYTGWTPDSATLNNKTTPEFLGLRQRFGAEVNYTWKFLNLKGEYLTGKDGKIEKSGYYGQISAYVLPKKLQLAGRYDVYDKDLNKDDNVSTLITLGANYFVNSNVLLQAAYTLKQEQGPSVDNNYATVQLQVSF